MKSNLLADENPNDSRSPRLSKIFGVLSSTRRLTEVVPLGPPARTASALDNSFLTVGIRPRHQSTRKLSFREAFGLLGPPMAAMVLGVDPNAAANYLMNTSELDDGQFWLIPDEWSTLQTFSVMGLALVLLFYVYILMMMLVWRSQRNAMENKFNSFLLHWRAAAKALTGIHGKYRKYWNFCLKIHDLVMLTLLLSDLLEAGTPVKIAFSALVEILIDSLFDFSATVLYPLTVLYYCWNNFHYDRAVYFINLETLSIGSFERRARMYANPAEIALVRSSFDSLRILDSTDFVLRIAMNLAFSYRCKRIVEVLIEMKTDNTLKRKLSLLHPPARAAVVVFTHKAIVHHKSRVLRIPTPLTYYEWTHPVDVSMAVSMLARAGTLETLQLINRQLTELPGELRGCRNLNFISLINCATEKFPPWLKDFHKLQYLQVEGRVGSQNLDDLAPDLFSDMPELRYLQLGVHENMTRLPPLDGAPKLRSIIFSRLYNLVEFPPLTHQTRLGRIELTAIKTLPYLPDLQPVTALRHLIVFQGARLCCNGFLGTCDLTNPYCTNATCLEDGSKEASPATLAAFKDFSYSVCQPYSGLSQVPTAETIQMCDGVPYRQCHVPGLEPNTTAVGMCYNHRMQVLACNPGPEKIRARRRQIQEGVGAPCNSSVEAWLGCSSAAT
ncbi:hypothetical protein PHYSODRAFT_307726 [Phytophthora sojae]|uniref:WLGC domain-containing protein n=1 Tax=Phytophthora sojae (strain P6497) TaxID=1094619 RepID=G5AFT5_PHYSP|nr:hypothetical protein PHYSODRAFT_307726 [Phytophthora sojae]EGZ05451.1 hypothetical protein PHYSODRAFT_307726 [Phytophthora sojae]|eukprot:XP_009538982.1 hypothetical protein PHYSODRAFT_307726 [Phytophthora sojae]